MLDRKFEWEQFKTRTNISGKSRGSNMVGVDDALKTYWDAVHGALTPQQQLYAAFDLMKACNSWLKLKKDKAREVKQKQHFKTRWDDIKALANAAFVESHRLSALYASNLRQGELDFERKKLRSATAAPKTTKALDGGYGNERKMWVDSKKTANPISATTLHEAINTLTDDMSIAYDGKLAALYGGNKVLTKNFDQMKVKDWQSIDDIMQKMEAKQGRMARHVAFLKKADRINYMAIVQAGKLVKNNGTNWNTGAWDLPYAMDEYGNVFIGEAAIATPSDRLNHSSLLAGKAVLCAGTLQINNGVLRTFNNNSGHYKPTGTHVYEALLALQDEHADLSQTVVTIKTSEIHGFGNLTVDEVIRAQGVFAPNHPKAY